MVVGLDDRPFFEVPSLSLDLAPAGQQAEKLVNQDGLVLLEVVLTHREDLVDEQERRALVRHHRLRRFNIARGYLLWDELLEPHQVAKEIKQRGCRDRMAVGLLGCVEH